MTENRPKQVVIESDHIEWEALLEQVKQKKAELESTPRRHKDGQQITETIAVQQESYPEKLIVLDEIDRGDGEFHYRYSSWVVSEDKLTNEGEISVTFSQFTLTAPAEDLQKLHEKAKNRNWRGPGPL